MSERLRETFERKFRAKLGEFPGGRQLSKRLEQTACGPEFIMMLLQVYCGAKAEASDKKVIADYLASRRSLAKRLDKFAKRLRDVARALIGDKVRREGRGGKTDPYRYFVEDGNMGTRTVKTKEIAEKAQKILVPESPIAVGNKNGKKEPPRPISSPRIPAKTNGEGDWPPWTPFAEQVAILEVDGGLTRAEAERSVRASMQKRPVK